MSTHERRVADRRLAAVFLSIVVLSAAGLAAQAQITPDRMVPFCTRPPVLDGKLDDDCWNTALVLDLFYLADGKRTPCKQKTEVRVLFDDTNVYFGVRCEESDLSKIKTRSPGRDQPDWEDDRIEFFIDVLGRGGRLPVFYLSINTAGMLHDQVLGAADWHAHVCVAPGKTKGAWLLEVRLPLRELGKLRSIACERWHMNIGRIHRATFRGKSAIVPVKRSFMQPGRFAGFEFRKHSGRLRVAALSLGEMTVHGSRTGRNKAVYRVTNESNRDIKWVFNIENRSGDTLLRPRNIIERTIQPGRHVVEHYYTVLGRQNETLVFRAFPHGTGNTPLYDSENRLMAIRPGYRPGYRTYEVKRPLYEELLDRRRAAKPRIRGHLMWTHPIGRKAFLYALQLGAAYSYQAIGKAASRAGFHFLVGDNRPKVHLPLKTVYGKSYGPESDALARLARMHREHGWSKPVVYAPYDITGIDKDGTLGLHGSRSAGGTTYAGWLPDPINERAFLDCIRATLKEHGSDLWAVFVGDEQFALVSKWGLGIFKKQLAKARPDSFIRKAALEIKNTYGFGKFGPPSLVDKSDPAYPFCRRAYTTWLHDKLRATNKKVRAIVKAHDPNMLVVSDDAFGWPSCHGAQFWSEYADIGSYQLHRLDMDLPHWTFMVKVLRDISGLDAVAVVPHDCDSGYPSGAMEPAEMVEMYSQILRGGGMHLHSWPACYARTPPHGSSVKLGYPLAWAYLLKIGAQMNALPPVRLPETAETAIMLSDEACKCEPSGSRRYKYAFAQLGPVATGWFRFISDTLVELGRARLGDYKIVYLPYITYTKRACAEALIAYCRAGGTIVCTDPQAFQHDVSGEPLAALRERLFGVRVTGAAAGSNTPKKVVLSKGKAHLKVLDAKMAFNVETVADSATVHARFDNGRPAIVENRIGKGRALYFACCPFTKRTLRDAGWKAYITSLHRELGGSTGHDIWRFRLPDPIKTREPEAPQGVCLTGNYAYWSRFELVDGGARLNADGNGRYTIRTATGSKTWPFSEGRLTNRRLLVTNPKLCEESLRRWRQKWDPAKWVETFTGTAPLDIVFRFDRPCVFSRVKLFFHGELAGVTVETGSNGKTWKPAGASARKTATGEREVRAVEMALAPDAAGTQLRLRFAARSRPESLLVIPEVEIWGRKPVEKGASRR